MYVYALCVRVCLHVPPLLLTPVPAKGTPEARCQKANHHGLAKAGLWTPRRVRRNELALATGWAKRS